MKKGGRKPEWLISDERGQSILEFVILVPLLVGILLMLIKANTAVQMAIVNQKYAREQALILALNSPVYPPLRFRAGEQRMEGKAINQMILGVADNVAPEEGDYPPSASTQTLVLYGDQVVGGSDDVKSEPRQRSQVRIRNTVGLCTQSNGIFISGVLTPAWKIREGAVDFAFCRSGVDEQ
jgi:hypothetical protein